MYKELSSWNSVELRIYRLLGVDQFRKFILTFEKIRHFKDKRKNENYHLSTFDILSLERYNGFIMYNAFLHSASLLFTLLYAILSTAAGFRNVFLDLSQVFLTLLNIYCIMLQRANDLKLRESRYKCFKRFLKRTDLCKKETIEKIYASEPQKLQEDYKVLSRIREAFEGRSDCILTHKDIENLKRICACFEPVKAKKRSRRDREALPAGLLERCDAASELYTVLQIRADWLQRRFGTAGRKMLDCTAIITEDAECEKLYRELIPEDTAYHFCLVCFLLYEAFTDMIDQVETNEA